MAGGAPLPADGQPERRLAHSAALLAPSQTRTFIVIPFEVPVGTSSLRLSFTFDPPLGGEHRNLLTLSLFDPQCFRGAGHRHAPRQEVLVGPAEATPGFVAGPIVPGTWRVEIDCHAVLRTQKGGVEYVLEIVALPSPDQVTASEEQERPQGAPTEPGAPGTRASSATVPSPIAVTEAPAAHLPAGWLKGDLHVHSNHSDGKWTVNDLVGYVRQQRLDFIALTDHNTITGILELERALREAQLDTIVIPAMELTTFWGHANALGVGEWVEWRVRGPDGSPPRIGVGPDAPATLTMAQAADNVRRLGGTFVVNHPRSIGYPACTGCRWDLDDSTTEYADVLEVWNGIWGPRSASKNAEALQLWDRWLNAGHRMPASAGTDSHGPSRTPHLLAYTFVHATRNAEAILAAVRGGRSYLGLGPALIWQGIDEGPVGHANRGELAVDVADAPGLCDVVLVRNGDRIDRRPVHGAGTLAFAFDGAGSNGDWFRAELYRSGTDDLLAMTNPLFSTPSR